MSKVIQNDLTIYDDFAEAWWDGSTRWVRTLANMVPPRLRFFERHAPSWDGMDVLDVGCAGGFLTEALAKKGAKVSGIDPADKAIAAADRHAAQEGLTIDYRVGVGEALPWRENSFDAVTCVDVLEHVESVDGVIEEAARVLRPGGWFLFDTINRTRLASFAVVTIGERLLRLLPRGAHDPELFIRPDDLREKLETRNFRVEPFRGLGPAGINRRGDPVFRELPSTAIIYLGAAQWQGRAVRRDEKAALAKTERKAAEKDDHDPAFVSEVVALAWEDDTPFDAIRVQTGLSEGEVIRLMRRNLKPSSFRLWRKRVSGRRAKHRALTE